MLLLLLPLFNSIPFEFNYKIIEQLQAFERNEFNLLRLINFIREICKCIESNASKYLTNDDLIIMSYTIDGQM